MGYIGSLPRPKGCKISHTNFMSVEYVFLMRKSELLFVTQHCTPPSLV